MLTSEKEKYGLSSRDLRFRIYFILPFTMEGNSLPATLEESRLGETFYAPRNLIASKGALSSGVAVSWDRVLDATGYQVYRSETNVRADAQLTGTIEALAESPESRVEYNDPSAGT